MMVCLISFIPVKMSLLSVFLLSTKGEKCCRYHFQILCYLLRLNCCQWNHLLNEDEVAVCVMLHLVLYGAHLLYEHVSFMFLFLFVIVITDGLNNTVSKGNGTV